ncbi:MotA/TolQ/ExbB proton channel family protein [Nannocystaceae bacterium ST9]
MSEKEQKRPYIWFWVAVGVALVGILILTRSAFIIPLEEGNLVTTVPVVMNGASPEGSLSLEVDEVRNGTLYIQNDGETDFHKCIDTDGAEHKTNSSTDAAVKSIDFLRARRAAEKETLATEEMEIDKRKTQLDERKTELDERALSEMDQQTYTESRTKFDEDQKQFESDKRKLDKKQDLFSVRVSCAITWNKSVFRKTAVITFWAQIDCEQGAQCPRHVSFTVRVLHKPGKDLLSERDIPITPSTSRLEVFSIMYANEEPQTALDCLMNSDECALINSLLTPDITRTPALDDWVVKAAMFGRIGFIPVAMATMVLVAIYCGILMLRFATLLFLPDVLPVNGKIKGKIIKFSEFWMPWLLWLESMGPALGFALTVVGLAVAFQSTANGLGPSGQFGNAVSLAMASTLCGLVIRILAHTARAFLERLVSSRTDEFGFETGLTGSDT